MTNWVSSKDALKTFGLPKGLATPRAGAMNQTSSQSSGVDDGIVITLIDSHKFPVLAEVASRNKVTVKDLPIASGLLILPSIQDSLDAIPHPALIDLCTERHVGMVTTRMAREMRKITHSTSPASTEAAFEHFVVNPHMLDVADVALNAAQEQGGDPDLNDKSAAGIQVLMMALVQRWTRHIEVIGQPDEARVGLHLGKMSKLNSIVWNHTPAQSPDALSHRIVYRNKICYNCPGVQGLALGRLFGKSVTLSIAGMPLAGFEDRIALYVAHSRAASTGILRDRDKPSFYKIFKGMDYLASSVAGLVSLKFIVYSSEAVSQGPAQQFSRPTSNDMAALKHLLLAAHNIKSLAIIGNSTDFSDGFAGGAIPGAESDTKDSSPSRDFYLPPFQFSAGESLPPLRRLHLWRYDWRCHSSEDVATHWNLSRLQSLVFDGAPLRWFLGTLNMDQMQNLSVLRIEDAEWAIQPSEGRQAALLLSLMLSHHIDRLKWLEIIGVYTDNIPITAIRRHAMSLEYLVMRHPYGLGTGVDAVIPSAAPALLLALLHQNEDFTGITPPHPVDEQQAQRNDEKIERLSDDENEETLRTQVTDGRLAPGLSRLVSIELDLDDRYMEQGDEPETLARLARLPMLRSVSLAVPSVLKNLYCVPKYDVDLHNVLQRLLFVLGQRQQRMAERKDKRGFGPAVLPLEQITFYIDGFTPLRSEGPAVNECQKGTSSSDETEESNVWVALREPHTAEAGSLHKLMATFVTGLAHDKVSQEEPKRRPEASAVPKLAVYPLQEGPHCASPLESTKQETMSSILSQGPTAHGLSFLQPREPNELDVSPGIAHALVMRSQKIRSQRCIVAEMVVPDEGPSRPDMTVDGEEGDGNPNAHDISRTLKYHLYEEYSCYAEEEGHGLTYFQKRDLREHGLHPRKRMRLPFVVHFELPENLPAPRWDVLGVPLYM